MQPPRKGPDYSREREFTVVLEDLQGQFRVFGEGLQDTRCRLERIEHRLEKVETDVSAIKASLPLFASRLTALEHSRR